jgi:molecular chaperone GrpE
MNEINDMELNEKEKQVNNEDATNLQNEKEITSDNDTPADNVSEDKGNKDDALQKKYDTLNDSHLRLMAEFDNYRKRTLREKADLIKSGGESALTGLLPVIDDFERAIQNIRTAENIDAVKEGIELIYNKFSAYLTQHGVKPIEAIGKPFDTEMFEAIATVPVLEEGKKGIVIDSVQTGYTLYDKVIRHARVVVGE